MSWIAPFKLGVVMTVECAWCDRRLELFHHTVRAGERLPNLHQQPRPVGPVEWVEVWRVVDGMPVCPNHVVRVVRVEEGADSPPAPPSGVS